MPRVTATVMFTDIVESTARAARAGARADDERRQHFELVRRALAAHEGREVKTLGDGFMAIFPSVTSAISCAVALQQDVEAANRGRPDPVTIRVGLGVGDVTEEGDDYFGAPVIEASRLCAEAQGRQILATSMIQTLCGGGAAIPFKAVGQRRLKGIAEVVDVVEVMWVPRVRGGVQGDFANVDRRSDDAIPVADAISAMPHMRDVFARVCDLLSLAPGQTILDAGCATGRDICEIAPVVSTGVGVDVSTRMIEVARARAVEQGITNVEFHVADLTRIDRPTGSVDGCYSVRTFQYLTDPLAGVRELRRITRPGGRVVISDTGWETSVWDGADPELTSRVTKAWVDSRPAGRVAQQLPGLFRRAGFDDVHVEALPNIVTTISENYSRVIDSHASQAVQRGVVTPEEGAAWVAELASASEQGRFLRAFLTFVVAATVP